MKVALIPPPSLGHKYLFTGETEICLLGFFHQPRYRNLFLTSSKKKYRILEAGPTFGPRHAHAVAALIEADEIILPNKTRSMKGTLSYIEDWKKWLSADFKYQLVVEGLAQRPNETANNVYQFFGDKIHALGLPSHLPKRYMYWSGDVPYDTDLLGTSTRKELTLWSVPAPVPLPNIRYLHTSRPIYMGQRGLDILDDNWISRPQAYMSSHKHTPKVYDNICKLQNYIGEPQ